MKKQRRHNSILAIGGIPSPLDSFLVAESFVLSIKLSGKKPAHHKPEKRYSLLL
jgi:hypothetical protein